MEEAEHYTHVAGAPLHVSDGERAALDKVIESMAASASGRSLVASSLVDLASDEALCSKLDEVISETLFSIRTAVRDDTAEKLFERLAQVVDGWPNPAEHLSMAAVFIRFADTMGCFIAYRGKFRGLARSTVMSKSEALAELKARGLTKRQ